MSGSVRDQISTLARAIIDQGKKDLISEDDRLATQAARYFFLNSAPGDDDDLKTFTGLCAAAQINADAAAEAIFNELTAAQKKRVYSLLRSTGYQFY